MHMSMHTYINSSQKQKNIMTVVGFEPTPRKTGA